jgi:hypothetical protein
MSNSKRNTNKSAVAANNNQITEGEMTMTATKTATETVTIEAPASVPSLVVSFDETSTTPMFKTEFVDKEGRERRHIRFAVGSHNHTYEINDATAERLVKYQDQIRKFIETGRGVFVVDGVKEVNGELVPNRQVYLSTWKDKDGEEQSVINITGFGSKVMGNWETASFGKVQARILLAMVGYAERYIDNDTFDELPADGTSYIYVSNSGNEMAVICRDEKVYKYSVNQARTLLAFKDSIDEVLPQLSGTSIDYEPKAGMKFSAIVDSNGEPHIGVVFTGVRNADRTWNLFPVKRMTGRTVYNKFSQKREAELEYEKFGHNKLALIVNNWSVLEDLVARNDASNEPF